jgi:hypothetical protein
VENKLERTIGSKIDNALVLIEKCTVKPDIIHAKHPMNSLALRTDA